MNDSEMILLGVQPGAAPEDQPGPLDLAHRTAEGSTPSSRGGACPGPGRLARPLHLATTGGLWLDSPVTNY